MFVLKHVIIASLIVGIFQTQTTHMVDLDGVKIRVRAEGLEARKPDQPVSVFESGGSAPLETWDRVFSALAASAPAVAYDRSGTGQSEWDSLPPTPERIVARLQRLLTSLGAAPPYVLVGHSWGGALIRYFAGAYPTAVAAMVYID